ncbi:MAG: electron transfer flavoprotein [Gemmatimonadetes bacterium]|nr:electron transfer flavoprotein [Gemmatimonadota bacterium]
MIATRTVLSPVVVGGGLAGGAAALRLAQQGHAPLLLERQADAHDKVCGEFLSVEASRHLAALGVDVAALGGAPIRAVRLCVGARTVEAPLPFAATGLTRRTLDAALLEAARRAGAAVAQAALVRRVEPSGGEARAILDTGATHRAPLLLATGKHDVAGLPRDPRGTVHDLVGFKQYWRATPALRRQLDGVVAVVAFPGGYAGVQLVEGERVNGCLLLARARLQELGGRWDGVQAMLAEEPALRWMEEAEPLLARPLAISNVPYGYLAPAAPDDGIFRLGDQGAVIPSFCGDGMSIALHSGRLAAEVLNAGGDAARFQRAFRRDVARQVRLAMAVQRLARTRWGPLALVAGFGALPGALSALARLTRVPPRALARVGA